MAFLKFGYGVGYVLRQNGQTVTNLPFDFWYGVERVLIEACSNALVGIDRTLALESLPDVIGVRLEALCCRFDLGLYRIVDLRIG